MVKEYINDNGNREVYEKYSNGSWKIKEYDDNNNIIYYENSDGSWLKPKYDNNNVVYFEATDGFWKNIDTVIGKDGNIISMSF